MKPAVVTLRSWLSLLIRGVGIEGAFLVLGAALLAIGAGLVHPAGPWLVLGATAVLVALALAIPTRRA